MRIGIKPNLVVAKPASSGATTHPEIVAGVIEYLQEHGYQNIEVLEGSWVGDMTSRAYEASGIGAVCRSYKVPYYDLQKDSSTDVNAGGIPIKICNRALALDYLINLPVLKGHCQTTVTCALKNHKGLIPNSEKRRFHTMGLHKPIAHLSAAFPKEFIVVDNICGDLDFEEGGNPVEMNRIFCCKDPVLCDAFVCETMGYSISGVPYIPLAERLGVGTADCGKAKITMINEAIADRRRNPSRRVASLARCVDDRDACSACYGSLIYALNRLDESGQLRGKNDKICIGQAYRGQSGRIGVGSCTAGFDCSLRGCPPTAAEMVEFLEDNWY
jgi:uncharacterized protein (DUF362 family)